MHARFGIQGPAAFLRDLGEIVTRMGTNELPVLDASTAGFFRPDMSLPAYAGLVPDDRLSPIYNFFDRVGGGTAFAGIATRRRARDWRGGRLTYDEHDGTDFVCPAGTHLACAAPGVLVSLRHRFLRGGLTASVDHGRGVVTQYTHLSKPVAVIGQRLERGETVALSGHAGMDMLSGFPWVPPHVHFMLWVRGRPADPYLAAGEKAHAGVWLKHNDPRPSGALPGDAPPPSLSELGIDAREVDALVDRCLDPKIKQEIRGAEHAATRLALLEDSVHHDRHAWPQGLPVERCRREEDASALRLSMPLPASLYDGARIADAPWTRP